MVLGSLLVLAAPSSSIPVPTAGEEDATTPLTEMCLGIVVRRRRGMVERGIGETDEGDGWREVTKINPEGMRELTQEAVGVHC